MSYTASLSLLLWTGISAAASGIGGHQRTMPNSAEESQDDAADNISTEGLVDIIWQQTWIS